MPEEWRKKQPIPAKSAGPRAARRIGNRSVDAPRAAHYIQPRCGEVAGGTSTRRSTDLTVRHGGRERPEYEREPTRPTPLAERQGCGWPTPEFGAPIGCNVVTAEGRTGDAPSGIPSAEAPPFVGPWFKRSGNDVAGASTAASCSCGNHREHGIRRPFRGIGVPAHVGCGAEPKVGRAFGTRRERSCSAVARLLS